MKDREGEKISVGDYVETISPKNFGEEGSRSVGMVVDTVPSTRISSQVGVVFGGSTYPLLRSISPKYLTKTVPKEIQRLRIERGVAMYREMEEFVASV